MMLNGNKEAVTLNLKSDAGRDLLRGLVRQADVLLENFAPGTLDRHGVGARGPDGDQSRPDLRGRDGIRTNGGRIATTGPWTSPFKP